MLRLGHAVGRVLQADASARPTVLIGKDTRISGYMIEVGARSRASPRPASTCVLLGPAADARRRLPDAGAARSSLGVVISASHNPFADNGIKFFSARRARSCPTTWEQAVEAALEERAALGRLGRARARRAGSTTRAGRYIEFCKSTFANDLTLRGLKIVVDAAHGAAYHVAPDVFHELGAEVIAIGCAPDGLNINAGFGATAPAGAGRRRAGAAAPTTASPSTATPTGCRWSTPPAASTTATSCST